MLASCKRMNALPHQNDAICCSIPLEVDCKKAHELALAGWMSPTGKHSRGSLLQQQQQRSSEVRACMCSCIGHRAVGATTVRDVCLAGNEWTDVQIGAGGGAVGRHVPNGKTYVPSTPASFESQFR